MTSVLRSITITAAVPSPDCCSLSQSKSIKASSQIDLGISGYEGKLYDNDENYFHSYSHKEGITIEGNIFEDYHNYSVNGVLINSNCSRESGEINTFFYSGINLSNFDCQINENYDPL